MFFLSSLLRLIFVSHLHCFNINNNSTVLRFRHKSEKSWIFFIVLYKMETLILEHLGKNNNNDKIFS